MNLLEDLIELIKRELTAEGSQFTPPESGDDLVGFLGRYYEYRARSIDRCKRKVLVSNELKASSKWVTHQAALLNLKKLVEDGSDLRPYQTKRIEDFDEGDYLFSDWSIHHLHLGPHTKGNDYAARTGDLLFATMLRDRSHFISVMNHHSFSELELLEIIEANWPDYIDNFTLHRVVKVEKVLTSSDIAKLRKAHINPVIQLRSGRVLTGPGGGVRTSGLRSWSMDDAARTAHILRQAEELIRADESRIRSDLNVDHSAKIYLFSIDKHRVIVTAEGSDNHYELPISTR